MVLRPIHDDETLLVYAVKPELSRECQRAVTDADMLVIFNGVPMGLALVGRTSRSAAWPPGRAPGPSAHPKTGQ
jgi:hypothetical protein